MAVRMAVLRAVNCSTTCTGHCSGFSPYRFARSCDQNSKSYTSTVFGQQYMSRECVKHHESQIAVQVGDVDSLPCTSSVMRVAYTMSRIRTAGATTAATPAVHEHTQMRFQRRAADTCASMSQHDALLQRSRHKMQLTQCIFAGDVIRCCQGAQDAVAVDAIGLL